MTALTLSPVEARALKAAAHSLNPVVLIGNAGLTPAVLQEIDRALKSHELIKVRISGADREARAEAGRSIADGLSCALVQSIGNIVVLYRQGEEAEAAAVDAVAGRTPGGARKPAGASKTPGARKEAKAPAGKAAKAPAGKAAGRSAARSAARSEGAGGRGREDSRQAPRAGSREGSRDGPRDYRPPRRTAQKAANVPIPRLIGDTSDSPDRAPPKRGGATGSARGRATGTASRSGTGAAAPRSPAASTGAKGAKGATALKGLTGPKGLKGLKGLQPRAAGGKSAFEPERSRPGRAPKRAPRGKD